MVIKYSGEDSFKSTYSSFYAKAPVKRETPIVVRHQPAQLLLSAIQNKDKQLVECRTHADYIDKKKYARPIGLAHDNPICLGLGSYTDAPLESNSFRVSQEDYILLLSAHKEIVSSKPPHERKFKRRAKQCQAMSTATEAKDMLDSKEDLDEMIIRLRWIPSTRRQQEEGCIPVPYWKVPRSTLEKNADVVRHRPKRYESSVGVWQTVHSDWNRVQMRAPLEQATSYSITGQRRDQKFNEMDVIQRRTFPDSQNFTSSGTYAIVDQCRVRKLPGYGGFVPREPVERNRLPTRQDMFVSSSASTYCAYPGYLVPGKHSKGPLSRMVTLVYPSNPFKRTPSTMQTRINPLCH